MSKNTVGGRYTIQTPLGQGAQGFTWRVTDLVHPERALVLKLAWLHEGRASGVVREFELLTRLKAPHLASVYDLGFLPLDEAQSLFESSMGGQSPRDCDPRAFRAHSSPPTGAVYLTRGFVPGEPADRYLAAISEPEEPRGSGRLVAVSKKLAQQMATALAAAHSVDVAHGDIKAENVILSGPADEPKLQLIDFGLGLEVNDDDGRIGGTPHYMAPELWAAIRFGEDAPIDRLAVDIYALGVLLYSLLSGRLPFGASDTRRVSDLADAHLYGDPAPLNLDDARLEGCVLRMLTRTPDQRPTILQVLDELTGVPAERKSSAGLVKSAPVFLPFLGRGAELRALEVWLGTRAPVALVLGEVGTGKRRLLEQLRWSLQREGHFVAEVPRQAAPSLFSLFQPVAEQLGARAGRAVAPLGAAGHVQGDRLHQFNRVLDALLEASGSDDVLVFWEGFDEVGEDLREWLTHFLVRSAADPSLARLRFVLTGRRGAWMEALAGDAPLTVELAGLRWSEVEGWARHHLLNRGAPPSALPKLKILFERCQGHPLLLEEALNGRTDFEERGLGGAELESVDVLAHFRDRLAELDGASRLLALLVALLGPIEATAVAAVFATIADAEDVADVQSKLSTLSERGLLEADAGPWQSRWPFLAPLLLELLDQSQGQLATVAAARSMQGSRTRPVQQLELWLSVAANLRAGVAPDTLTDEVERSVRELWSEALDVLFERHATSRAIDNLIQLLDLDLLGDDTRRAISSLGDASLACGKSEGAIACLTRISARHPAALLERARILNDIGQFKEAVATLESMRDEGDEACVPSRLVGSDRFVWLSHRAATALRSSQFELALELANSGLSLDLEAPSLDSEAPSLAGQGGQAVLAQLSLTRAAASTFLGAADALELLEHAQTLLAKSGETGRSVARLHTFKAMALSRHGELDAAAESYRRALEEAERSGLDADLPTYLLNVGTAYHRQGRFGLAREYYARGTRVSTGSTRASTRAGLLCNQANIDISLGRTEESRELLRLARSVLQFAGLPLVTAFADQLEADADTLDGHLDRALASYVAIAAIYAEHGDSRHQAEVLLKAAGVALDLHRVSEAQAWVDVARGEIESGSFADLQARQGIIRARILLEQGGLEGLTGIELFRQSLLRATEAGDHLLVLRNLHRLLRVLEREGMKELAEETEALGEKAWNSVAVGLTRQLRRDVLKNLEWTPQERVSVEAPPELPAAPARTSTTSHVLVPSELGVKSPTLERRSAHWRGQSIEFSEPDARQQIERFYRVLALNARIINEPDLKKLLAAALDTALSLTGAERGFLLLADESGKAGEFKVALSRDVDGESIARPHLKVSLTIARQVARSSESVCTEEARQDPRFDAAMSVQDLELTSVLCVPIRDRTEVLGTLYLDHRFRRSVFNPELVRLMEAFADQLAIALVGARRLAQLEAERRELQAARAHVEALLTEKEALLGDLEVRCQTLAERVESGKHALELRYRYDNIVAAAPVMRRVLELLDRVVDNTIPVVVLGESGTGKEVIARAIHFNGPRAEAPFIAFNCGAVSESLIESELFGYVKGAFTGAERDRDGLFVAANNGTLFLDELGEMPASMQVKLLRTLQEKQVRPVGSSQSKSIDVRIIAATNRDLESMVAEKTFRQDLYYRLAGITLHLPPLRERREDIPLLINHFLDRLAADEGVARKTLTPRALTFLYNAPWPGNVRHLENVLRSALVLSAGDTIDLEDLLALVSQSAVRAAPAQESCSPGRGRRPKATRPSLLDAMKRANGDRPTAASMLGVSERTLYRYLAKFGLT